MSKPEPMIVSVNCLICGDEISGTVGELINIAPICEECRKTRKKVKRGI